MVSENISSTIAARLVRRCEEMGISTWDVSKQIGRNRNYINDLIKGRKKGFSSSELVQLCSILMCEPGYLLGLQDEVIRHSVAGVPIKGAVEPGAWRKADAIPSGIQRPAKLVVQPDRQHPAEKQGLYYVFGSSLAGVNVSGGSVLLVVEMDDPAALYHAMSDGDLVVVEAERGGLLMRTVLSVYRDGSRIMLMPIDPDETTATAELTSPESIQKLPVRVLGIVLQVMRFR